jgi:hypothetical protein
MDISSLLNPALALYGLLALVLLAVVMGLMRGRQHNQDSQRSREGRIILLIMFLLVVVFIAVALTGR